MAAPGLRQCQAVFRRILESSWERNPAGLAERILESGCRDSIRERFTDSASRLEDLEQFILFAENYDSLSDFLSQLALLTNMAEEGDAERERISEDRVVLSTIHQAKGLEWSAVFLIWCAEGMIPLNRALKEPGGEEEERRLFYVATTRAKDQLYLCYPVSDYGRGMGSLPLGPSRFIRELRPSSSRSRDLPYEQWLVEEEY